MLWLAVLTLAQITDYSSLARQNPHTTAADAQRGQRTFMGQCAGCHGPHGEGAKGPPLNRGVFEHARTDFELFRVIRSGISGTEMPSAIQISDKEIWQTIAFVKTFAASAPPVTGNATNGAKVYASNGCAGCHLVRGAGRALGPDLTDIGLRRSPAHLRTAILEPNADIADAYTLVTYANATGGRSRALRLNEDSFSVRVLDLGTGAIRSFWKEKLNGYRVEHNTSAMPPYRFESNDLDDLVAYLTSLRGAR